MRIPARRGAPVPCNCFAQVWRWPPLGVNYRPNNVKCFFREALRTDSHVRLVVGLLLVIPDSMSHSCGAYFGFAIVRAPGVSIWCGCVAPAVLPRIYRGCQWGVGRLCVTLPFRGALVPFWCAGLSPSFCARSLAVRAVAGLRCVMVLHWRSLHRRTLRSAPCGVVPVPPAAGCVWRF